MGVRHSVTASQSPRRDFSRVRIGTWHTEDSSLADPFELIDFGRINQNMSKYRRLRPVLPPLTGPSPLPLCIRLTRSPFPGAAVGNVCIRGLGTSRPSRGPGGPTNFDTLKVVQRLEAQGFTPEQSKAVMELLKDVIDESVMGLTRTMVTREEQDKVKSPLPFLPWWYQEGMY